jgi:hypothetical protein
MSIGPSLRKLQRPILNLAVADFEIAARSTTAKAFPAGRAGRILLSMAQSGAKITINPNPRKVGTEWLLEASFSSGEILAIRGFKTEAEAREWVGSPRYLEWLREKGQPV